MSSITLESEPRCVNGKLFLGLRRVTRVELEAYPRALRQPNCVGNRVGGVNLLPA